MFSKIASKNARFASAKFSASFQKRSVVKTLKNVYFEGAANTEDSVASLRKALGTKDDYKTKYPDQTIDDYGAKLKAELARPIFYDEAFISSVSELLGYKKEEIRIACSATLPEVTKPAEVKLYENAKDVDWDVAKRLFSQSKVRDMEFSNLSSNFKKLRAFVSDNRALQPAIDWAKWSQILGEETVAEVKKDADTVSDLFPHIDASKLANTVNEAFEPLLARMKDKLIDDLPELQELSATLEKETPLLKTDEHGLPIVSMSSPEFLDEYYPEVRDRIIEEIETSYFDTYYRDDRKKLKVTPDILLTFDAEWKKREGEKIDEAFKHELTVASSVTAEARAFQQMYLDVTTISKRNTELEAEVSQLRAQIEAQQEEAQKKDKQPGQETQKAKKEIPPHIMKILLKHAQNNKTAVKEFPGVKKRSQTIEQQQQQQAEH